MKKILATLAGTLTLALGAGACSAVDTQETKSIAPIAAQSTSVQTPPVLQKNFDRLDYFDRANRSATRPVKPALSAHENHVKQVNAANRAARAKAALAKAKALRIAKAKAHKAYLAKKKAEQRKVVVKKKTTKLSTKRVGLSGIAACIAKYESGGNPRAENPTSSASGLFQFIDGTWRAVTGRHDRASDAPVSVQIAAFYKLWNGGRGAGHWVTAHKCGW